MSHEQPTNEIVGAIVQQESAITEADSSYATALLSQFHDPSRQDLFIGDNFRPSSLMTETARTAILGATDYALNIKGNAHYLQVAQTAHLTVHSLDAGKGSSFSRPTYLENYWRAVGRTGESTIGAKSTDTFFPAQIPGFHEDGTPRLARRLPSVMAIKLNRVLSVAPDYSQITIRPVLNRDSEPSAKQLLDTTYITDKSDRRPVTPKRTYTQVISDADNVDLGEPLMQADLPSIDHSTGQLTYENSAAGGHGQVGTILAYEMAEADYPQDGISRVRTVFNGDGTNNFISPEMVGFAVAENAGFVMLTTTKTGLDKKGGLIGVEAVQTPAGQVLVPQMVELAQSKKVGQQNIFRAMGLEGAQLPDELAQLHEPGQQYFNTNVLLANESLLSPFLKKLRAYLGEEEFAKAVTPELIENQKEKNGKTFTQLEGAIGTVMLKLNRLVLTNPDVKTMWRSVSGNDQLLRIVNLDPTERDDFFTPVKYALDYWLQAYTDHYRLDTETWKLVNLRPSHRPAIGEALINEPYYADIQRVIDALGNARLQELDELDIDGIYIPDTEKAGQMKKIGGKVHLEHAILAGTVHIVSKFDGVFDLNSAEARKQLGQEDNERLSLKNLIVEIEEDGTITTTEIA